MDPLNQLVADLKAKRDEFQKTIEKPDMTADDLTKAEALKSEIGTLRNRIEVYNKAGAFKGDLSDLDSFLRDPVRGVPFENNPGNDGARLGFETIGSYKSGESTTEYNRRTGTREIAWEDGEGIFGAETYKAICSPDYRTAFRDYLRMHPRNIPLKTWKTLETGIDDQGGYLVPVDLINRIVQRKPTPTRIAAMVENLTTSREFVEMLKLNYATDNIYTTGFRVTKTGEQAPLVTSAQVTDTNLFGTIKVPVHTFMIRGLVTLNQIEDAAFNPLQFFSDKFSETVEILRDDKMINGSGRQEPTGMLSYAASSLNGGGLDDPNISVLPSGDPNTITADGLKNLNLDVPEQYDANCTYVFNKTSTYKAIKLLKDLNDRYIFGYGLQDSGLRSAGRPTDLDGYPFVWSQLMPNIAASAYPVIFGDLKGATIVNRIGFSIQVLRELYAELGLVSVVGRVRFGGQVLEPWRLRLMQIHA